MKPSEKIRLSKNKRRLPKVQAIGQHSEFHEDVCHSILRQPWWSFLLLIPSTYIIINALFALAYLAVPGSIQGARPGSFMDAFFFSVQTMATIGYGGMIPINVYGHVLVTLEALLGMLGAAFVTGITFTKFARPTARVLFSNKLLIGNRNGIPHLMVRLSNWRHNRVFDAHLRMILLITEVTSEGETMRWPIELPLVRDHTALLWLTWTAMHRIDEKSPFYGNDALERLRAQNAELFVTLSGIDETFAQQVYDRHSYTLNDIIWNARFADVIRTLDNGTREIDYRRFHKYIELDSSNEEFDIPPSDSNNSSNF